MFEALRLKRDPMTTPDMELRGSKKARISSTNETTNLPTSTMGRESYHLGIVLKDEIRDESAILEGGEPKRTSRTWFPPISDNPSQFRMMKRYGYARSRVRGTERKRHPEFLKYAKPEGV